MKSRWLAVVLMAAIACGACAAAAASVPRAASERAAKGYELYSWRDGTGAWRYGLVPGTNRTKSWDEVAAAAADEAEVRASLRHLAAGETVTWCNERVERPPAPLELPPFQKVQALVDLARRRHVNLSVCRE